MEIELNFDLDPIERLGIETENTDNGNAKQIGTYLIAQFQKDEVLKNCYKERKITLEKINDFVMECAKKELDSKSGFLSDEVVYGWVIHYVQDEEVIITENSSYSLTKEDKESAKNKALEQYQKEQYDKLIKEENKKKEAEKKKLEKQKAAEKENKIETFSLFEL